jgi:hypothetical protein
MKFLAKLREVHLDKMSTDITRIVVPSPALMKEDLLGDHVADVFKKGDEQAELDGRERELTFSSPGLMAGDINSQVTGAELGFRYGAPPGPYLHVGRHHVQVRGGDLEVVISSGSENFTHPPLFGPVSDDCDQSVLLVLTQEAQKIKSPLCFIQRPHAYDCDERMLAD